MSNGLSVKEKEDLYKVIVSVIGEDSSIKMAKPMFNEQTIVVVRSLIEADRMCNEAMKELVTNLMTAGRLPARKWLKKALGRINSVIKASADFNGYGCSATVKARWKSSIISSTI